MGTKLCHLLIFALPAVCNIIRYGAEINKRFCGTVDLIPMKPWLSSGHYTNFGNLTIKLSVFYDRALLNKYANDTKVEGFIYRTVSSASMAFRHSKIRQIANFSLRITKIGFFNQAINAHADGDEYLNKFCIFIKGYHFDNTLTASVLFTGHNFRRKGANTTNALGMTHSGISCDWFNWNEKGLDPCIIVEGRDFKAALVLAHELGHTLGMSHDEAYCGDSFIMSEYTGDAKTRWSLCSVDQLNEHLKTLRRNRRDSCLTPDNKEWQVPRQYESTSTDIQCETALGPKFHQYITSHRRQDICNRLVCTDNTFLIPIHPAIENTPCGTRAACIEGMCRLPLNLEENINIIDLYFDVIPDEGSLTSKQFVNALTINGYPAPNRDQYKTLVNLAPIAGAITSKQELAMFLAQILWESGGLKYKKEVACAQTSCPNDYRTGREKPGKYYYGRGYIHLTWLYNYESCSKDLYGDNRLVDNPDLVSDTEDGAWMSAFWYWKKKVHSIPDVQKGYFGATTMAINGVLECKGPHQDKARKRFQVYIKVLKEFDLNNVKPIETGCYN